MNTQCVIPVNSVIILINYINIYTRRLFRQLFEEGKFKKISSGNSNNEKLEKFRLWLRQQYISVKNEMLATSRSDVLDLQVPSIRTVIEVRLR